MKWDVYNKTYGNIHQDLKIRKEMRQIAERKKWSEGLYQGLSALKI
jgi:hypothetical protein